MEFLDGTKALIKVGDERKTLGYYAELIVEKLAKQVGLEHAQNDLVVWNGKKGILSKSIIDKDEELYTLDSITKTDNRINQEEYSDIYDLYSVLQEFMDFMKKNKLSKEEIKNLFYDF